MPKAFFTFFISGCLAFLLFPVSLFAEDIESSDIRFSKTMSVKPDDVDVLEDIDDVLFSDFFNVLSEDLELIEEESLEDDYQETVPPTPRLVKAEVSTEVFDDSKASKLGDFPEEFIRD